MSKQVLGRGFEGLIPTGFDVSSVVEPGEQIKQILITDIDTNPDQPRKFFDAESINELSKSIKQHGVLQPLIVTPKSGNGKHRIVAGERRYRASIVAGIKKVPAIIRDHRELEELEIALVENVQRVDLLPLETAVSIVKLRDQFSLSPKQIAEKLGKAETTISNIIRLLNLPNEAITSLQKGEITEGHARAILSLKFNSELQLELLKKIVSKSLSVRDTEEEVKKLKVLYEQKSSSINKKLQNLVHDAKTSGISLKIHEKKKGGSILISYSTINEAEKIIECLIKG